MPSSPPSTTTTTTTNYQRKRSGVSITNRKRLRRSDLAQHAKDERQSRAIFPSDSLRKINHIALPNEKSQRTLIDSFVDNHRQVKDQDFIGVINKTSSGGSLTAITHYDESKSTLVSSYDSDEEPDKIKGNFPQISPTIVTPLITSSDFIAKSSRSDNNIIIQQTDVRSNSSTRLMKLTVPQSIKMLSNTDGLSSALRIPTKIQLTKPLPMISTQNDQQSTTTAAKQRSTVDYPLTPPPPVVETRKLISNELKTKEDVTSNMKGNEEVDTSTPSTKRSLWDWSVPPTSELSPTSLTSSSPDLSQNHLTSEDSLVELDLKTNRSVMKRRYRPLSLSCPVLPNFAEKSKPITPPYKSKSLSRITNSIQKKTSSLITNTIQRLRRKRKDNQFYVKRSKPRMKTEQENQFIVQDVLNQMIKQIDADQDKVSKHLLSTTATYSLRNSTPTNSESRSSSHEVHRNINEEHIEQMKQTSKTISHQPSILTRDETMNLNRQTSTPLSFHSIPLSSVDADEQSMTSPLSDLSKPHIVIDIVNELIKGAKGLDKLSHSLTTFTNSIHDFVRLTNDKQADRVEQLQRELEKKCSTQLNRANLFCAQKIQYFITKHALTSLSEYVDGISLIVKYFYLYVLSLNCRKQELEVESMLNDLVNGKSTFINESFCSSTLTTIIEDYILPSSLASDYLLSQPLIIDQKECSLPFVRNPEYENELLYTNDIGLTSDLFPDLEDYLKRCENTSSTIPTHPTQQPSTYYPTYSHSSSSVQYYPSASQSTNMTSYYYSPPPPPSYAYNHLSHYYNSLPAYGTAYHPNEQYNYYYNQPTSYTYSHSNSTNDIPLVNSHPAYQRMNSNVQRKYSNYSSLEASRASVGFDNCNSETTQSKSSAVPSNIYLP
ncbi:unnamed protein product [Adineta ricciae]|uniref:Uncharacterized protein n=2 Tax=Adineta ricciae TaxID=249248 RepID=A0A814UME8_ADIRI|nr:unnamed protein product [Adineta ricciae]